MATFQTVARKPKMSDGSTEYRVMRSFGEDFCRHASDFAALYGAANVDNQHILFAATEVSPTTLHGYSQLTSLLVARVMEKRRKRHYSHVDAFPRSLTKRAQVLIGKATSFAARTNRDPTIRDLWVALSQDNTTAVRVIFERLAVDRTELRRRVSGA